MPGTQEVDRAQRWLYRQVESLRDWRRHEPSWPLDELLAKALAGVEALVVCGALAPADGDAWAARLRAEAVADAPVPDPGPAARASADGLLASLLASMPDGAEPSDDDLQRFEGALHLLGATGAADGRVWDARLRERAGWPTADEERAEELERDAGAVELDVLGVHAGPETSGDRVVLVVRFADAVTIELACADRDDDPAWPEWQLADDAGTAYLCTGEEGDGDVTRVSFEPGPPPAAQRLTLTQDGRQGVRYEVALG